MTWRNLATSILEMDDIENLMEPQVCINGSIYTLGCINRIDNKDSFSTLVLEEPRHKDSTWKIISWLDLGHIILDLTDEEKEEEVQVGIPEGYYSPNSMYHELETPDLSGNSLMLDCDLEPATLVETTA